MTKEYYQKHKEKLKKVNREWFLKNKEQGRQAQKVYRESHKEEIKRYRKEYYKKNWYFLNKHQTFQMSIPEARKMSRECEKCKDKRLYVLHWHHRDQDRKNNKKENLQVLCANCHMETHYEESLLADKTYKKR